MRYINPLPCACGASGIPGDVGPGTQYPVPWDLSQYMGFFWKDRSFICSASITGVSVCDNCDTTVTGSTPAPDTDPDITTRSDTISTMGQLMCTPVGGPSDWMPSFYDEFGVLTGNVTLSVDVDCCDVKFVEGLYYIKVVVTASVNLGFSSSSDSDEDAVTDCPAVLMVSDWKTYVGVEPPVVGSFTCGILTTSMYLIPDDGNACDILGSSCSITMDVNEEFIDSV